MQRLSLCRVMHASFPAHISGWVGGPAQGGGWVVGVCRGSSYCTLMHSTGHGCLASAALTGSDVYMAHGQPDSCWPWCVLRGSITSTPHGKPGGGIGKRCSICPLAHIGCIDVHSKVSKKTSTEGQRPATGRHVRLECSAE